MANFGAMSHYRLCKLYWCLEVVIVLFVSRSCVQCNMKLSVRLEPMGVASNNIACIEGEFVFVWIL